ncbi:MAG: DEAD/SNF2-like helicase [Dasosvirus sp.]|uniref:DEAD/SNF2-like helicase n=1 Tax=Dasosvirus sp. TaxID=2487764 RepID=A0A3G4ZVQ7_9VIRU|nr:MAG: DEAD/SNF2-like helicase [Dasosvirus sp.]
MSSTRNNNMYKSRKNEYINLKINGRLFPTWILANFSQYRLPEIFMDGSDPCNVKKTSTELKKYQEFLGKYLDYNSPYRDILIYHGLGSGKTRTAINIYNVLYNYSPDWNVFILLKATLRESTWMRELEQWLQVEEKEFRNANIEFISYDAPNADKVFLEKVKNSDASKKSMYIIDEVHNFINNVYTNLISKQGRRALTIYEHIIQDKKDNEGVRVILISGSPAINIPYELGLLFNLLRPGIFPKSESQFNQLYVSTTAYPVINPANKNNFQRRILGLVSYYVGATPEFYAKKTIEYIDVPMSEYQTDIYEYYERIEEKITRRLRSSSSGNYRSYTKQASNFVFPMIEQGISGETRPRPRDFKINESDIELVTKGRKQSKEEKEKESYYKVDEYLKRTEEFVNAFDKFLNDKLSQDIEEKHTLAQDIENFFKMSNKKFTIDQYIEFVNDPKIKKSNLLKALHDSSAKMMFMILNILNSAGPVLVYSNYVVMEGLQIFKIYLKYFGFSPFSDRDHDKSTDGFRYTEYHGGIDPTERRKVIELFNRIENKLGQLCKIVMISPAGAEGISFNNIRQVHIMEPYWHEVRITQMIGRAIRNCSHKNLPMSDREVTVFRYKSVRPPDRDPNKWTTDQYIEDVARSKEGLISSFLDPMKEASVDCALYRAHNSLVSSYRCFQFEEKSLFDDMIGPAYKDNIYDDLKLNNGLNSQNSMVSRIKVVKIKAVKQLKSDQENDTDKYSEPEHYWYNQESRVVYDLDLQYPVGKVGLDEFDLPLKLTQDTFIITHIIPIPIISKNISKSDQI